MRILTWVPGAVGGGAPGHTLPTAAPDMAAIVSAEIIRVPSAGAIGNHAVHAHDLVFGAAQASAVTVAVGAGAPLGAAAAATVPGGGATGVQNLAAAQTHTVTGADPVVAATPTLVTARTFTLVQATLLGDLLTLRYRERGETVLAS